MVIYLLLGQYYEKVAERIKDTGVSVRKRAIKIIRDLCISQSNFPEATQAFIVILSRVTDEESSVQVPLMGNWLVTSFFFSVVAPSNCDLLFEKFKMTMFCMCII